MAMEPVEFVRLGEVTLTDQTTLEPDGREAAERRASSASTPGATGASSWWR
mgnify:CR=1 FL=1